MTPTPAALWEHTVDCLEMAGETDTSDLLGVCLRETRKYLNGTTERGQLTSYGRHLARWEREGWVRSRVAAGKRLWSIAQAPVTQQERLGLELRIARLEEVVRLKEIETWLTTQVAFEPGAGDIIRLPDFEKYFHIWARKRPGYHDLDLDEVTADDLVDALQGMGYDYIQYAYRSEGFVQATMRNSMDYQPQDAIVRIMREEYDRAMGKQP